MSKNIHLPIGSNGDLRAGRVRDSVAPEAALPEDPPMEMTKFAPELYVTIIIHRNGNYATAYFPKEVAIRAKFKPGKRVSVWWDSSPQIKIRPEHGGRFAISYQGGQWRLYFGTLLRDKGLNMSGKYRATVAGEEVVFGEAVTGSV